MARGSVYERTTKDGRRVFYVMYRDAAGRQVKRTVGPSRREAERVLARALVDVERGALAPTRETFRDYAERWLADHTPRVEPSTAIDYGNSLRNHLIPFFGDRRVSAITTDLVREYVAQKAAGTAPVREQPNGQHGRIKAKLSPKTINNQVTLLRTMLGHAAADGIITRNPLADADRRRPLKLQVPHRERDYLRPDEVGPYLDACSPFWRPRAMLMLLTGMRIGEVLALEWRDVDWHGNAIIVRRSLKTKGADRVGSTKGDEDGRRVDMGPALARTLRDHQAAAEEMTDDLDRAVIFPAPGGGYDDPGRVLRYEHREALKRAGLRLTLVNHELRHTAAAVWLSLGLGLEYVRRQMGHRSITTTITNYGHLEPSMTATAARRVEAAMGVTTALPRPPAAT